MALALDMDLKKYVAGLVTMMAFGLWATPIPQANAQSESASPGTVVVDGLEGRIDAVVLPRLRVGNFNGVVLIAQGENVLFRKAYGDAVYEFNVPNTAEIRFRIASLSKQFTDTAICTLIEQGHATLDSKLSEFMPEFPRGDEITIRHLLTHESGVKHTNKLQELDHVTRFTLDEMVQLLASQPLDFDPGTDSSYSNGGYDLLVAIIEKASGMPYEQYFKRYIFDRFGLEDTGVVRTYQPIPLLAQGYLPGRRVGSHSLPRFYPSELRFGGGALYSTVDNVFKLFQATFSFSVFEDEELNKMVGWNRTKRYEITGRAPGFVAKVFRDNPNDITVVSLANNYSWQISWGRVLYQAAIDDPWDTADLTPVARRIPPEESAYYEGWFAWGNDDPVKLSVDARGNIAYFDEANDWDVVLVPLADGEYYHPFFDRIMRFEGEGSRAERIVGRSAIPNVEATAVFTRVEK